MSKLLLYCTKAKPYLIRFGNEYGYNQFDTSYCKDEHISPYEYGNEVLNGKIVAECDFEVENLRIVDDDPLGAYWYETKTLSENEILEKSCLTSDEIYEYLGEDNEGYAIHIKNLHIFDEPKELNEVYKIEDVGGMLFTKTLTNAPKNMMRVSVNYWEYATYNPNDIRIIIPVSPQEMCRIANKEQTILIRRNVLKEMLKNE